MLPAFRLWLLPILVLVTPAPAAAVAARFNPQFTPAWLDIYDGPLERRLVDEAAQGELKSFTPLEAGLVASGALDEEERARLAAAYERAWAGLVVRVRAEAAGGRGQARAALDALYEGLLRRYQTEATTLVDVLRTGVYNCVSTTYLYNLTLARLGFATRAVVVPGHVYAQARVGGEWLDVETTVRRGFHPYRSRSEAAAGGERVYVEDQGAGRPRHAVPDQQLTALIYYNRGTLAYRRPAARAAARLFLKALRIYPSHRESSENLLAAFVQWSKDETAAGRHEEALRVGREARQAFGQRREVDALLGAACYDGARAEALAGRFGPAIDRLDELARLVPAERETAEKNAQGYYAQWSQTLLEAGDLEGMLKPLEAGLARWRTDFLLSFRVHLVALGAGRVFAAKGAEAALRFFDERVPRAGEDAVSRSSRQQLYDLVGRSLLGGGELERAWRVYRLALAAYPGHPGYTLGRAWALRRWLDAARAQARPGETADALLAVARAADEHDAWAGLAAETARETARRCGAADWAGAAALLGRVLGPFPAGHEATSLRDLSRQVYRDWAGFLLGAGRYGEALAAATQGLARHPDDAALRGRLAVAYCRQGLQLLERREAAAAERVLREGLALFPEHPDLLRLLGYLRK